MLRSCRLSDLTQVRWCCRKPLTAVVGRSARGMLSCTYCIEAAALSPARGQSWSIVLRNGWGKLGWQFQGGRCRPLGFLHPSRKGHSPELHPRIRPRLSGMHRVSMTTSICWEAPTEGVAESGAAPTKRPMQVMCHVTAVPNCCSMVSRVSRRLEQGYSTDVPGMAMEGCSREYKGVLRRVCDTVSVTWSSRCSHTPAPTNASADSRKWR